MHFRRDKKTRREVSINESIDYDRDGNPLTYEDILYSETDLAEETDLKLQKQKLYRYMDLLDERQKKIITLRYGLDGGKPLAQREVAERLGISRSYVSRIEKAAVDRLAAAFGVKKL